LRLVMTTAASGSHLRVLKCRGGLPPARALALPSHQRC